MTTIEKNVPELRFPGFEGKWQPKRLGETFTPSRTKGTEGIPTLSVTLREGLKNRDDVERHTPTNLTPQQHLLVGKGDIAYNMMRMWQGAFGRAAYDGIVSPAYVVLRPKKGIDSRWAEYYFKRKRSIYWFWAYSYGLTKDRLRLYANDFKRVPSKIPTLPEQRKIADFLTAVDGRIGQLIQKRALLEDYKKGVMQQIFTQAIRFQDDHGNDFPDWEEKKLGDVSTNVMYGMNAAAQPFDGVTKYIRITDIDESSNKFCPDPVTSPDEPAEERYKLQQGDIVFARTGASVGKSYLYDETDGNLAFAGFLIRFSIRQDVADAYFVYLLTQTSDYRKWVKINSMRSGQPGINAEEYKTFPFELPSVPEQTKIANFLSAIDRRIDHVATQITATQTFKRGLLQQMFV